MNKKNIIESLEMCYEDYQDVDLDTLVSFLLESEATAVKERFKGFVLDLMDDYFTSSAYNLENRLRIDNLTVSLWLSEPQGNEEYLLMKFNEYCRVYEFNITCDFYTSQSGAYQRLMFLIPTK